MQESENNTWQSYLENNYKSNGTKTNLQDIKLPAAQKQVAPSMANISYLKHQIQNQILKISY